MLKPVNYDETQHVGYIAGRDMGRQNPLFWRRVFESQAPATRPLSVLDLGAGTGRFTTMLAETFGGETIGVEPSAQMRRHAIEGTTHANVRFVEGRAEDIPLADKSIDLALMFLSFHHVRDRKMAASEISRVLRPGGLLFIRSQFADRFPKLDWHTYFPRARDIELEMFPALSDVEALFASVGLRRVALLELEERLADGLAQHASRLRHRAISTFEHMGEAEIETGFAALNRAVAADDGQSPITAACDLLILGGV